MWCQSVAGAELNVAVALARLGWRSPTVVSVLPEGLLGDHVLDHVSSALGGAEGARVKRAGQHVGIVHVWRPNTRVYQRDHSAFCELDPSWFSEDFWQRHLVSSLEDQPTLTFLHLSGVPPLLCPATAQAWANALVVTQRVREAGEKLVVTLELTPRRDFGGYLELWMMTAPHLRNLDILELSLNIIAPLWTILGARDSEMLPRLDALKPALVGLDCVDMQKLPQSIASIAGLDLLLREALLELRDHVVGDCEQPALLLVVKLQETKRKARDGPRTHKRWSMACVRGRVISTSETAVSSKADPATSSADAWLAGVIDGLSKIQGAREQACAAEPARRTRSFRFAATSDQWHEALRQGDRLSAIKESRSQFSSDLSDVTRAELEKLSQADHVLCEEPDGGADVPAHSVSKKL